MSQLLQSTSPRPSRQSFPGESEPCASQACSRQDCPCHSSSRHEGLIGVRSAIELLYDFAGLEHHCFKAVTVVKFLWERGGQINRNGCFNARLEQRKLACGQLSAVLPRCTWRQRTMLATPLSGLWSRCASSRRAANFSHLAGADVFAHAPRLACKTAGNSLRLLHTAWKPAAASTVCIKNYVFIALDAV